MTQHPQNSSQQRRPHENKVSRSSWKSRSCRRKFEFTENDAFLAITLARIGDDLDDDYADSSSESSYDDDHLNLSKTERRPLIPAQHMSHEVGGIGDTTAPFEITSVLNNKCGSNLYRGERIMSIKMLDDEKRVNSRMSFCLILLLFGMILTYDRNQRNRNKSWEGVENTAFVYKGDGKQEWWNNTSSESELSEIHNTGATSAGKTYYDEPNTTFTQIDYSDQNRPEDISEDQILKTFGVFSNWEIPFIPIIDVPVFWHIPRTGGTTLKSIISHCLSLVATNEIGVTHNHSEEGTLQVVTFEDGGSYVNVDTTTRAGINRAREMNLTQSGLADIMMTPYLHDIATLFDSTTGDQRIKCFTVLRHPIHRAVSMFRTLQDSAKTSSSLRAFQNMSLEEYATSAFSEENWMVRFLTNEMVKPLRWHHLELAKEILGSKCIVGFVSMFEESIRRFDQYFGWNRGELVQNKTSCSKYLIENWISTHNDADIKEGSKAWNLLKARNGYDIILYEYATKIFERQTESTASSNSSLLID